jgi:hypothetical protein
VSGPNSTPARGQQDYRTPPAFLAAVQRKFGVEIAFDLACTSTDCVTAPSFVVRGFFHDADEDALAKPWPRLGEGQAAWVNPPFAKASAFARVASESPHCRTLLLTPASVGSKWFAEHVYGHACIVFLRPRIVFLQPDGSPCPAGINRDCMLAAYGWTPGVYCEDWRQW